MNSDEFSHIFHQQILVSEDMLLAKAQEYATDDDRLHNFKLAAALEGTTCRQALAGFMAKHTVSIYDMCRSDKDFPLEVWNEKITDHINYLILLKAVVCEDSIDSAQTVLNFAPKHI